MHRQSGGLLRSMSPLSIIMMLFKDQECALLIGQYDTDSPEVLYSLQESVTLRKMASQFRESTEHVP